MSVQSEGVVGIDGIGARLRSGRERAGLSLLEAAERLHVDPHAVEALEAEQFEEFGASVYVRGHLRHYAELIGESPLELQELYATSGHAVRPPDLTRLPSTRDSGTSRAALVPGVAVILIVALVGSAWWIFESLPGSPAEPDAAPLARTSPDASASSAAPTTARANGPTGTNKGNASLATFAARGGVPATGEVTLANSGTHPVRAEVTAAREGTLPLPQGAATAREGMAAALLAAARPAIATAHPRISQLQLHFSEDSWAEVYDAHGERLLFDVGSADSTRTVSGAPPLRVVLGNPVGVSLELDGRPIGIPEGAARNVSIEFRINRSGRVAPSRLAAAEARNEESKPGRD